jgi:hypothetical protein
MFSPAIRKQQITPQKTLNIKQDLFCKIYATDPNCLGNATKAYMEAYKCKSIDTAKSGSRQLLEKHEITARINEYIEIDGFNDMAVDKKHNFLIKQNKDFNVSLKAIQEYNKLKKRVTDRLEISIPKPIIELDEDTENARMIGKEKKAVDVEYTEQ